MALTTCSVTQALGSWPVSVGCDDVDVGRATYLAVDSTRSVKEYQVKNYGDKCSQASEGVKLPELPFSKKLNVRWGD
jgi:hypothetical protein